VPALARAAGLIEPDYLSVVAKCGVLSTIQAPIEKHNKLPKRAFNVSVVFWPSVQTRDVWWVRIGRVHDLFKWT
jgi:hypothetical protein